uniref:EamA domain-containing protein n=1 Tax=Oryza punctata TaxID=4537 RepID=A0A0E0LES3_ORYPU
MKVDDGPAISGNRWAKMMSADSWRWCLGLIYIVAVASIWIAASYIVQSVVDGGVSPFLITYICNSLFVIYIPIVEAARYFEDSINNFWTKLKGKDVADLEQPADLETINLLHGSEQEGNAASLTRLPEDVLASEAVFPAQAELNVADGSKGLDAKGRWTRARVARVSMVVCPFWFLAQLTFNLSLRYTTVTSNTILSSTSSLFTFLVALVFLGETFTWLKLISVLLCMGGTIIVSLGDSGSTANVIATNPLLGDVLSIASAGLYAVYITLIRKKLPDEKEGQGEVSMAQFLGFLGLFNMLFFLPIALVLNFTKLEPFHRLTWEQVGLIVGKGLLDNVLSDYLWAKAILLTTTTVATAGLTIQVPIAAIVDTLTGHAPHLLDYIGAAAVLVGFAGINIPVGTPQGSQQEHETPVSMVDDPVHLPSDRNAASMVDDPVHLQSDRNATGAVQ